MASKHLPPEQQNFVRLSSAKDEARVVLGYVLHSQIPPEDLVKKIQEKEKTLLKGKYKLNPEQLKLCYIPGPLVPDYKTFDITLLYKLIRNLCSSLEPSQGWDKKPRQTEIDIGDDIERLRNFRNELSHVESSSVPDDVFNSKWTELENIFKRIQGFLQKHGITQDLEGGLKSIKRTAFALDDYDKCQLRLTCEHLNDRKAAPGLTLEGCERKICGESACFVIKFGDGEVSNNWPITWQRIKGNITEKLDTSAERYRGSSSQRLVIAKVSKKDEGEYQVTVSREEKGTHIQIPSNPVYLTVTGDAPILDIGYAVFENDSIPIYYKMSTNDESPDVERAVWSKDGRPLDENAEKYSGGTSAHTHLTIHSPTSTDMGQYSCEVFNAVGSTIKTIDLNSPSASINDNPTAVVGDSVTITATIQSSPTLLSAKWQKSSDETVGNFTDVDINDSRYYGSTADREDPKLCIPKTTREDGIFYRLVVSNGLGQCESNTVFLKLVDVPSVFVNHETRVSEQSVKLVCIISLYQQSPEVSRVLWTKDCLEIDILGSDGKYTGGSIADPSLTINEFNPNDNGKYQCCASNSVGQKWSESILLDSPSASINDNPTAVVGDSVTITATIQSSPTLLSAKWQKSSDETVGNFTDVDINDSRYYGSTADREDPKLCIPKTTREDGIFYRLVVSNGLGQCESNTVFLKLVEQHAPDDKKESVPDEVKDKIKEREIDFLLTMSPEHAKYHSGIAQISLLMCRKRRLNGAVIQIRPEKPKSSVTAVKIPVELLRMSKEDIKTFVKNYKQGSTKVYCGRAMVVGCFNAGKTTLVRKLKGEDVSFPPDSTRGLEVHTNIFIVDEDETCLTVNKNQTSEQRLQINLETLGSEVVKTPSNAERSNPKPDSELPSTHIPPAKNNAQSLAQTQEKKNDSPFRTLETGKSDNIPSKDGQNSKKPGKDPVKHPKIDQNTEKDVNKTDTILGQKTGSSRSYVTNKPVKTISLLDFAGQDAYYACHHIFLSPRTSYMLVTDMSKELTERPTNAVQMEGLIYSDWKYQDYINHWLGSIHTYSSETAPVILVQSHSDKTEKNENYYFRKVLGGVAETLHVHLSSKKKFAVEKDTDKNIEELKSSMLSIVKSQSHWGESIPTSWVHLEAFMMEIKNEHMVWKKEDLWKKLQSESSQPNLRNISKEDMTTALKMFNDLGLILFTTSSESIILDVQWFVDAFKNILTDEEHAKHDIAIHYRDWEKFNKNGILSKNLVREIWRESMSFTKYADDLILHMIRLGMIAEMEKGETYYVPCMNKQKYDKDVLRNCICSSTVCFMFQYLPLVIFHRLIATCMTEEGWRIWDGNYQTATASKDCVFHTATILHGKENLKILIGITENKHTLDEKYPYSIEMQGFVFIGQQMQKQFTKNKLKIIKKHLKSLTSCFGASGTVTYRIGYRCSIAPFSDTPDSHIIAQSARECIRCRVPVDIDHLDSFWMADENESTEIDGKKRDGNLGGDNTAQQSTVHADKVSKDRDLTESKSESEDRLGDEEKKSGDTKLAQTGEDGMKDYSSDANQPLYTGAKITLAASMILLVSYAMKHALTGDALADLLVLVEMHCLTPNLCVTNFKTFKSFFRNLKSPLQFHHYCEQCHSYHGEVKQNICPNCHHRNKKNSNAYFLVIPIISQLSSLFADGTLPQEILKWKKKHQSQDNGEIADIMDGQLYKERFNKDGFFQGSTKDERELHISFQMNTDGVSLFHSSSFSIWPVYLIINELPPHLRFSRSYRIFAGLWFGYSKPDFGTFLKPFAESLHEIYRSGQMERPFLDEARFTADIHTGYSDLLSVSCVSEERVWTSSQSNNTMKLLTVEGQLLSSVQTKSGNWPHDITVTREGDLVYTDSNDRTINLVRDNKIRTLITLQGWEPLNVCCTAANHLLVIMDSDDETQSKVVRYSGSTETQTIQYDVQGRPLYSSGDYTKYISENRNLDICVADWAAKAVVVVNQSGTLRFRYTGHPSNTGPSFVPVGIATDSQGHILTADPGNDRIHILDQDGQFLRYIHNLHNPWGLCVDSRDNLFVAEYRPAKVKRIQYLESQR